MNFQTYEGEMKNRKMGVVLWVVGAIMLIVVGVVEARPNKVKTIRTTGTGVLSYEFSPGQNIYLSAVKLHLNGAATQESLTITIDSNAGTQYDTLLLSQDMTGLANVLWLPGMFIHASDKVVFSWTNTDAATWGLEINYER